MAYGLRYQLSVVWLPDGAGPMTVPDAQVLTMFNSSIVTVPGGNAPTTDNFDTAIEGPMTADLEAQIDANIAQIQGFATGSG